MNSRMHAASSLPDLRDFRPEKSKCCEFPFKMGVPSKASVWVEPGGGSLLFIKAQAGRAAYHYQAPAQS